MTSLMSLSTVLLVLATVLEATPIFDRNYTRPYVLKKTWVQNFIKFQYIFEGKQGKAKIVPLGCVPSNVNDGKMLKVGEHFIGHDFVFSCEEGEDGVLNYEAIACVDAYGSEMQIGEARRLSNGTVVLHCNIFGGALKKVVERAAGCYFNETIYGEDVQWVEPLAGAKKMASSKSSSPSNYLTGRLMQCFRPHFSYYESHVIGCVVGRLGLRIGEFAEIAGDSYVKCVENELGQVTLEAAQLEDLSCTMDNSTFAHNSKWNDTLRAAEMQCNFGHMIKTGCLMDNQLVSIGQELKISNGCVFLCHPQTNVYICDYKLGDFNIIEDQYRETEDNLKRLVF